MGREGCYEGVEGKGGKGRGTEKGVGFEKMGGGSFTIL